jgi:sterol desaturase/sphingolipid hydroxylase (fatty acid hydroxylase superfamily)
VHHSDPDLDTTTLRHHPIEERWVAALISPAVLLIGISPGEVVAYTLLEWFMQSAAHANLPLPTRIDAVLRHFIVTPGFHRCHHSRDPAETDTNYGQTFTVWDRLFSSRCRSRHIAARVSSAWMISAT